MTREELAAILARLKAEADSRLTILREVIDLKGARTGKTIVRGTFVMKDENSPSSAPP